MLLGPQTRSEIEAAMPDWLLAAVEAELDMEAALNLADLETGAEVTVFFGSWCSDSQRELARFWKALDFGGGEPGFSVRYVALDRSKKEPAADLGNREILFVPTFIVERDGRELGQIIEHSPNGIEQDLLMLLEGRSSGWISARDDVPTGQSGGDR
jgi:thiol-disulfide isomerase/thioredoxin